MNGKNSHNFRVFTNFLAFLILIVIAIISVVSKFSANYTNFSAVLGEISKILAYLLVSFASLWYVASKRGVVLKIVWVICVAVITILMFV